VAGAGLLFIYSVLLLGPIPIMLFQASQTGSPVAGGDILFLVLIASLCLVPLGLFLRGIVRS
jgi:hypothetical protein